jgi:hypothetical protein
MLNKKSAKKTEKYLKGIFSEDGPKSKAVEKKSVTVSPYGSGSKSEISGGVNATIPVSKKVDLNLGGYGGKDAYGKYGGYTAEVSVKIPIGKKKRK